MNYRAASLPLVQGGGEYVEVLVERSSNVGRVDKMGTSRETAPHQVMAHLPHFSNNCTLKIPPLIQLAVPVSHLAHGRIVLGEFLTSQIGVLRHDNDTACNTGKQLPEHLHELYKRSTTDLNAEQKRDFLFPTGGIH